MAGGRSRVLSHQLSNGLYVSGSPDEYKERQPTMSVTAMPYTGGDIKKSGELGKMFDIKVENSKPKRSSPRRASSKPAAFNSYQGSHLNPNSIFSVRTMSHSGPLASRALRHSGPLSPLRTSGNSRHYSASMAPNLPATGLITSDPIHSGPLFSSAEPKPPYGLAEARGSKKSRRSASNNQAVNKLSYDSTHMWNRYWRKGVLTRFINNCKDTGLEKVKDGQHVKITGVVTCGSIALQSSFQKVNGCVYTCTNLYEYRSIGAKPARPGHAFFTWGLRHAECHVVDFYISDIQSGLRALVRTGYNASVIPFVKDSTVVDITKNKELPSNFLHWLTEKNLSSDNRVMRLKEGYVKEGSTVTVWGVVQRLENTVMIVPPLRPIFNNCQFNRFLLLANLDSIVLKCDDNANNDPMTL